jgi:hypothetical protein
MYALIAIQRMRCPVVLQSSKVVPGEQSLDDWIQSGASALQRCNGGFCWCQCQCFRYLAWVNIKFKVGIKIS